jgi:hypothetical protein
VPFLFLLGYAALHVTARLFASMNLAEVDPEIEVHARALALSYAHGEPPLYTWIIFALERLTGPGVLAYQLVKYAAVIVTGLGLYTLARRLTDDDPVWSLLAVEALALIYQLSWRLHEGFSGELIAFAVVPWLAVLLLRLADGSGWRDALLFGFAALVAMESTTPAALYLAALLATGLLQPATRRVILSPYILPALAAVALAGLHLHLTGNALQPPPPVRADHGPRVLHLAYLVVGGPILFLLPHLLILPALFPGMVKAIRQSGIRPRVIEKVSGEHLLLHAAGFGVLLLAIGAVTGLLTNYAAQWVGPLFLTISTWATAMARRGVARPWQVHILVALGVALALFAFGLRLANMYVQQPVCKICRWGVPYDRLAEAMKSTIGPDLGGTQFLVADIDTAGNLVRFFSANPITAVGTAGTPLTKAPGRPVLLLWHGEGPIPASLTAGLEQVLDRQPAVIPSPQVLRIPWHASLAKPDGRMTSVWSYAMVK